MTPLHIIQLHFLGLVKEAVVSKETNALEIASIEVDRPRACLVLSAGVSSRWSYAFYKKNKQTEQEAEAWEAAKKACGGLHFLAIQESLASDSCAGFWLMLDMPSPPV
eukprot:Gb_34986 [translate_table: standard]